MVLDCVTHPPTKRESSDALHRCQQFVSVFWIAAMLSTFHMFFDLSYIICEVSVKIACILFKWVGWFFLELEEFLHLMEASLLSDKFCRIFSPRLIFLFILLVVTSDEQKFLILIKSSLSVVNGYHIFLSGNIKRNNQLENSFAVSLKLSIHLLYDQVFPLLGIYSRE